VTEPADPRSWRELFLIAAAGLIVLLVHGSVRYAMAGRLLPRDLVLPACLVAAGVVVHVVRRLVAPRADPVVIPVALLLSGIGVALVDRLAERTGALWLGSPQPAAAQALWALVGMALAAVTLVTVRKPYQLTDYKYLLGLAGVVLFLAPVFVGTEVGGARLWIRVGGLSFQPSEFGKICLVLFFAAYLAERGDLLSTGTVRVPLPFRRGIKLPALRHFGPVLLIWLVSLAVLVFEKDLGSSLLFMALFVAMLFLSTGRVAYTLAGGSLFALGAWGAYRMFAHVRARVDIWLDPFRDVAGKGYQIAQSLFAIAAGGVAGVGLGQGLPTKIPAVATDFVFAAVAEELGLLGGLALLGLYAILALRGLAIAAQGRSRFTQLAAAGLALSLGLQTLLIVGGVIRMVPLTGITLPFMSQGGSSLVASWIVVALLVRISDDAECAT
jgi:peptidoglycan glycosyltransferase